MNNLHGSNTNFPTFGTPWITLEELVYQFNWDQALFARTRSLTSYDIL
jgi:hypothetical protein